MQKLLAIGIFLLLAVSPLLVLSQARFYFDWTFGRLDTCSQFPGPDCAQINGYFHQVLDYLSPPFASEVDPNFFSAQDAFHLQDVQAIFLVLWVLEVISLIIVLFVWARSQHFQPVSRLLLQLMLVYVTILLLLSVWAMLDWESLFNAFHLLLFPGNTSWLLDPITSNLIKYVPDRVFQELGVTYICIIVVEVILINIWQKYVHRRKN